MNKAITTVLVTGATIAGVAGVLVLNPTVPSVGSAADSEERPTLAEQDRSAGTSGGTEDPEEFDSDEDSSDEDSSDEDDLTSTDQDEESGRSTSGQSQQATTAGGTSYTGTSYTGSSYQSPWGAMQVSISVSDGQITDIQWEQIPLGDGHSSRINSYAAPLLVDQALAAQSASVDGVSGATYTTEGFRTSLQSAIQKAGL